MGEGLFGLKSVSESVYIADGIAQNVRNDGRSRTDFRHFSVDLGVIPHANGSCQLKMDRTDILVGVNLEIAVPDLDTPDRGLLTCAVECATSASAGFEGKGGQGINVQLSQQLEKMLRASMDLKQLCIIPGKTCWNLCVDALVLDSAGSLSDAISLAVKAAISDTRVPALTLVQGEKDGDVDFEVDNDPLACAPLPQEQIPLCVSLTKVGNHYVMDSSEEEEQCMSARISVYVNEDGAICGVTKVGAGAIAPGVLTAIIESARTVGLEVHGRLSKIME